MNCGLDFFFFFSPRVRGGGVAGDMEVRLSTNILQRLDGLKLFWPPLNPSLNSLTQQTWDFLHQRLCRSTRYSPSSGEPFVAPKKKKRSPLLSAFTSFSRGTWVWLRENHKHDSPLAPLFIYFLPLLWMELCSALIYQPDVFSSCCVEIFSHSSSRLSKAPKRFPPGEGIKTV